MINAIRKEDRDRECLLRLNYRDHLWLEKEIKSVANVTHQDIAEFLPLAAEIPLRPRVRTYPLEEANRAVMEFKRRPVRGAKVLMLNCWQFILGTSSSELGDNHIRRIDETKLPRLRKIFVCLQGAQRGA